MDAADAQPAAVTLLVTNRSPLQQQLVLEPAGETYTLDPGESRTVTYAGDFAPRLSIDLGEGEAKIWDEGSGVLNIR